MFTFRQKLIICGSVLISALLIVGSYFGSRWLHGPDVEPLPEHLLSDGPRAVSTDHPVRASVSQYTPSVFESQSVIDNDSILETEENYNDEEELETLINSLSDEELTALAESLEQEERESSKYPAVPEGYPSNLTPVWLEDYFDENLHADHVIMDRVAIELWIQGERGFENIVGDGIPVRKVYLLYPDVVYVSWNSSVREGPDGEPIEAPYISSYLGTPSTVEPLLDGNGRLSTEALAGVEYVKFSDAGYDPATILNDY